MGFSKKRKKKKMEEERNDDNNDNTPAIRLVSEQISHNSSIIDIPNIILYDRQIIFLLG